MRSGENAILLRGNCFDLVAIISLGKKKRKRVVLMLIWTYTTITKRKDIVMLKFMNDSDNSNLDNTSFKRKWRWIDNYQK